MYVRKPSYGGGTSYVYIAGVHHYRWHGTWVSSLSQATSGTPVTQVKGENYSTTMPWIRARLSFAILRTSLLCLRGSRSLKRVNLELKEMDFNSERGLLGSYILIFNYYYNFDIQLLLPFFFIIQLL